MTVWNDDHFVNRCLLTWFNVRCLFHVTSAVARRYGRICMWYIRWSSSRSDTHDTWDFCLQLRTCVWIMDKLLDSKWSGLTPILMSEAWRLSRFSTLRESSSRLQRYSTRCSKFRRRKLFCSLFGVTKVQYTDTANRRAHAEDVRGKSHLVL